MIRAALSIVAAVSVAAVIAIPSFTFGSSGASGQTTGLVGAGVLFGTVAGALAGRAVLDGGNGDG